MTHDLFILLSGTFAGLALGVIGMLLIESEEHKIIYIRSPELESFVKNPTVRVKNVKVKKKIGQGINAIIPGKLHSNRSEVYTKPKHKEWGSHTEGKIF